MNTTALLNEIAYPVQGQNVRRKATSLYDKISVASGTTDYFPFTSVSDIFTSNKVFPLSGSQIFAITSLSLLLEKQIISTALYSSLLILLQQSYLQIDIDSRLMLKIPLIEILSYNTISQQGTTTVAPLQTLLRKRNKNLIIPIVINSNSDVEIKIVVPTATATAFAGSNLDIALHGIMLDKLDNISLDLVSGNQFSEIAWTLWETMQVSSIAQNTFNFFSTPNVAQNLSSGTLPLSSTERLEVQAIELFVGGNPGTADTPALVRNNRIHNILSIDVEQINFLESNLENILSLAGVQSTTYLDSAATPVATATTLIDIQYAQKVLDIPLVIPAIGNVKVELKQAASSLNSNQYFTLMLKGKKTRQVI